VMSSKEDLKGLRVLSEVDAPVIGLAGIDSGHQRTEIGMHFVS
jgi:hypothetical protein